MSVIYGQLLVVSSNPERLAHLTDNLRAVDLYEVTLTNDLAQAGQLLRAQTYDLVLVDVDLKDCAGREFLDLVSGEVPVPVIAVGEEQNLPQLTRCIEDGASDYLLLPVNSTLLKARIQTHLQKKRLQEQAIAALHSFNEVEKLADDLRLVILPLGVALSAERNFDRLVERFVVTAMDLCNADAGTLFMRTDDDQLRYAVVRTRSLDLACGGTTGKPIPYHNLPLYDEQGRPAIENVAVFTAHEGISVNIANIYDKSGFDFSGTRRFDSQNNYRSISCLTVPLENREVTGVLQLRNALDPETGQIVSFGPYQQLVAESLASQAAVALHNRRLRKRETTLLRYKRELQIGREIQAGFFPAALPQPPGWEITARFQPAREVAGDFYDAFPAPRGKVGLVIADVCDKGVVAALFMAILRSLLRAFIQQHYYLNPSRQPQQVQDASGAAEDRQAVHWSADFYPSDKAALLDAIRLTNAYIGGNHAGTHIFATLFAGILDPQTGQLVYVNCGHLPPLLLGVDGRELRLMPSGPAIGLLPDAQYGVAEVGIEGGDILLAYTDGISEARNQQGELFGAGRISSLVASHHQEPVTNLAAEIELAVKSYSSSDTPSDDMAMLILKRKAEELKP
ncbi:MAG: SpoIIE family protein phosphatase [Candidatus Promineifilaceae bacterium]|nr:SpoIIE family protein phosphatase [Candidatus Promineifilaceae bacterium]